MPNEEDLAKQVQESMAAHRRESQRREQEDEQEAQREVSHEPLMQPHVWPMLERPASPEQLGQVLLIVSRTQAGRLLLNELVVAFLLSDGGAISAERQQGQADVVRYVLQHLGIGLNQRGRQAVQAPDANPWREIDNGRR